MFWSIAILVATAADRYAPSERLNAWGSLVVTVASCAFLLVYLANGMFKRDASKWRDYRFILRCYVWWTLACASWLGLWCITYFSWWPSAFDPTHILKANQLYKHRWASVAVSNINTLCQYFAYRAISRGSKYEVWHGRTYVLLITAMFIAFEILTGACVLRGDKSSEIAELWHSQWSLIAATAVPLLLGWAFRVRYEGVAVLILSAIYAASQVPAYYYVNQIPFTNRRETFLCLLMLVKWSWALAITCYCGYSPVSNESLIIGINRVVAPRSWHWRLSIFGLTVLGATILLESALVIVGVAVDRAVAITTVVSYIAIAGVMLIIEYFRPKVLRTVVGRLEPAKK